MTENQITELLRALDRIANALEAMANCVDENGRVIGVEAIVVAAGQGLPR